DVDDERAGRRTSQRCGRVDGHDRDDREDENGEQEPATNDEPLVGALDVSDLAAVPTTEQRENDGREHDDRDKGPEHEQDPPDRREAIGFGSRGRERRRRIDGEHGAHSFHHPGPTGAEKSPVDATYPSSSISSGSWGSGQAAGPVTGFAACKTSNADWWQGHNSVWLSGWYRPTGQPACVHTFENATSPDGVHGSRPAIGCNLSGCTCNN